MQIIITTNYNKPTAQLSQKKKKKLKLGIKNNRQATIFQWIQYYITYSMCNVPIITDIH